MGGVGTVAHTFMNKNWDLSLAWQEQPHKNWDLKAVQSIRLHKKWDLSANERDRTVQNVGL